MKKKNFTPSHEFFTWLYGRSARNAHIREMAQQTIEILKQKQSMEYIELSKTLGIGFDQYQKPKRTFYFVVNPLKKVNLIKEKRIYTGKTKKQYKTHYMLTPSQFKGYITRVIEEFMVKVK